MRSLVSDVRSMHKLLSTDSMITDRAIASEIKNNNMLLVKRESNLRKLWATDTLFTTIPCLEMIEVPAAECCSFMTECTIARTKHKIPRIADGNYQYVIQGVYTINALTGEAKKLKEISVNRYTNMSKLKVKKKEFYYFVSNDYIYVTNPDIQAIRLVAFFEEDVPNEIMYPDCCCGKEPPLDDYCMNPLDRDYGIPGYLKKQVLDMTSQRLLQTYFNIKTDMVNNLIDEQAPNAPNPK